MQDNNDKRKSRKSRNKGYNQKPENKYENQVPYQRTAKQQAVYNKATTLLWKNLYEGVKQFSEKSKNLYHIYNTVNLQDFIKHLKVLYNEATQLSEDLQLLSDLHDKANGKYDN